jgi:thymidylate kinase
MRNQRIIILDGPDGCGKTNIGQELSRYLGIPYFKVNSEIAHWRQGKFKEALEFDQTYISEFLLQTGYDVIVDRAYPSEYVYSKVFKRETNIEVLKKVDEAFAKMGAVIVIPVKHDYSKNRQDELVENSKLDEIHHEYERFARLFTQCSSLTLYVDDLKENLHEEMKVITQELFNINLAKGWLQVISDADGTFRYADRI